MTQSDLARKYKKSESTISYILAGTRYTRDVLLAIDLSRISDKKAIEYIHPNLRDVYQTAYPELKKRYK